MAADIAVSSAALVRYNDRLNGVPASNSVEVYLDGHYGNDRMHQVYPCLLYTSAYSIADRPGFMPGLMGGYLAQLGTTTAPRLGWISSGFWGAIVAGFAAGLAVRLLNYLFRRIPQELDHIKTGLLLPLLSLLFVGALMVMAINPPLGRFNAWLSIQLDGMQGGSRLVLGTCLLYTSRCV